MSFDPELTKRKPAEIKSNWNFTLGKEDFRW